MPKVLVLFAHPALEHSRINRAMMSGHEHWVDVTFHDLYQLYPDFVVDVQAEQELLLTHDIVVWQHPLYWYSVPPLLKQWIDLVLQHGWAYGRSGVFLRGKPILNVVTAGGIKSAYCPEGHNEYTLRQFLYPLERTAALCGMRYLPPYVVYGTHAIQGEAVDEECRRYKAFVLGLASGAVTPEELAGLEESSEVLDAANARA